MSRRPMQRALFAASLGVGLLALIGSAAALRTGARAPEIGLDDLDGASITIASLRGNVVIVDFWASWCEPCAEEMPVLERLYQQYRGQGLRVVGVSQDRTAGNIRSFLRRHRVSFPIVHDGSHQVAGRYQPGAMPTSFVIDRNGVVRSIHEGYRAGDGARLEREVRSLLGQR